MRHYLLISHGTLAEGMKSSVELITGIQKNLYCINAYINEETDIRKDISEIITQYITQKDELIVFSDILGGSVNNIVVEFIQDPRIHIVTGMNLPLILTMLLENENDIVTDIQTSLEAAKENMCYYNQTIQNSNIVDEDF